jgi:ankyrin repeat protein
MKLLLELTPDGGHVAEQLDYSLRQAVLSQREEAAKLLLDWGANPNKSDVDGKSPLFHAMSCLTDPRSTAIVRLLNDHGVDPGSMAVEQLDYKLRQAVLLQREEVIKLLLDWGADPNRGDVDGKSPLFHAMFCVTDSGSTAIVRLLRDHGADPGSMASRQSDRSLWPADAPRVAQQTTAGVQYQCSDTIQFLLGYGIDINICNGKGETIMHVVVKEGMDDSRKSYLVRFLSGAGANVDARTHSGETALNIAVGTPWWEYGGTRLETVRALCECGARSADQGSCAEANINAKTFDGLTAVHLAVNLSPQAVQVLKILCEFGADANAQDASGNTALHWVASSPREQRAEMIRVLKTAGANLDTRNLKAETPLHVAVYFGNLESTRAWIDCGADLHARNSNGVNALQIAIRKGYSSVASILKENGADLDMRD